MSEAYAMYVAANAEENDEQDKVISVKRNKKSQDRTWLFFRET